jgi:thiamine biosynthesis lipoprotein ApbE
VGADSAGPELAGTEPAGADWRALGTLVRLVVTDPACLPAGRDLLAADLAEVDAACSRFRPDSELMRLDGPVDRGEAVPVSPLLAEAVGVALRAARLTDGCVDPTVGAAMSAVGYDRDFGLMRRDGPPLRLTVRAVPGYHQVDLDPATGVLRMAPGIRLDLGATAKAWAADRSAARLAARLGCGVLVSLGGDIAVAGPPPGGGWSIRVQDVVGRPDEPATGPSTVVSVSSGGLATSSTTARRWQRGASVLHHILDPRTGLPARSAWRTVSVAAASCADANAASTAATIKGEPAVAWLAGLGLAARLVSEAGEVHRLGGWPPDQD